MQKYYIYIPIFFVVFGLFFSTLFHSNVIAQNSDSTPIPLPSRSYIQQSILSKDGLKAWHRICPADNKNGILWNDCTPYQGPVMIDDLNLPGYTKGAGIRDQSGYTFIKQGQKFLQQSIISADGKQSWSRTCPVNNTIEFNNCIKNDQNEIWNTVEVSSLNLPGGQNVSLKYQTAFSVPFDSGISAGQNDGLLAQILLSTDQTMWIRFCPLDNNLGVDWNNGICKIWYRQPLGDYITGAPIESVKDFADISLFYAQKEDAQFDMYISLLHENGKDAYQAVCPLNVTDILNAERAEQINDANPFGCKIDTWEHIDFSTVSIPEEGIGTTRIGNYSTYSFQTLQPISLCPRRLDGDISCDGVKNEYDYQIWEYEHLGKASSKYADLDGDGKISGADFEQLRRLHFNNDKQID